MIAELKKTYFIFLIPSIIGFILKYWAKAYNFSTLTRIDNIKILAASIFILSIALAIALPIFYRTLFAYKNRDKNKVLEADLIKFEKRLIYIAMATPYLALSAYVLELNRFYTGGAILMGLYAIYYFFPSKKRLELDKRIFRIK